MNKYRYSVYGYQKNPDFDRDSVPLLLTKNGSTRVINGDWYLKGDPQKKNTLTTPRPPYDLVHHLGDISSAGQNYNEILDEFVQSKKTKSPTQMVKVARRDPAAMGEHMWGCHSWLPDQLAATCENDGVTYKLSHALFEKWDNYMTNAAMTGKFMTTKAARTEGLKWLICNAKPIYDSCKQEFYKTQDPTDPLPLPTPDEDRDWFCWLFRYFVEMKRDKQHNPT